jgi:hypothetical protein
MYLPFFVMAIANESAIARNQRVIRYFHELYYRINQNQYETIFAL